MEKIQKEKIQKWANFFCSEEINIDSIMEKTKDLEPPSWDDESRHGLFVCSLTGGLYESRISHISEVSGKKDLLLGLLPFVFVLRGKQFFAIRGEREILIEILPVPWAFEDELTERAHESFWEPVKIMSTADPCITPLELRGGTYYCSLEQEGFLFHKFSEGEIYREQNNPDGQFIVEQGVWKYKGRIATRRASTNIDW